MQEVIGGCIAMVQATGIAGNLYFFKITFKGARQINNLISDKKSNFIQFE